MNEYANILIGRKDGTVWFKVRSQGSLKISPLVKDAAESMFEQGVKKFVVDLAECPSMDSTFMGTLSGIALKLRKRDGSLDIINANQRNRNSLLNLGLDAIMQIQEADCEAATTADNEATTALDNEEASREQQARVMLDAHRALVDACPDNLVQFEDVIEYLRKEVNPPKGS